MSYLSSISWVFIEAAARCLVGRDSVAQSELAESHLGLPLGVAMAELRLRCTTQIPPALNACDQNSVPPIRANYNGPVAYAIS